MPSNGVGPGVQVMAAVYGPRPTDRREGFSQRGFLTVDVKLASFATRERGRVQQVAFGSFGKDIQFLKGIVRWVYIHMYVFLSTYVFWHDCPSALLLWTCHYFF